MRDDDGKKVVSLPARPQTEPDGSDALSNSFSQRVRAQVAEHGYAFDALSPTDEKLVDDEVAFQQRFGFDWPRVHRRELLWLKRDLDLTDAEIRLLQRTGNFVLEPSSVRLDVKRSHYLFGWAQIVCLGVFIGVPILLVVGSQRLLLPWQWVVLALWSFGTYGVGRGLHYLYVRPYQIFRRTRAMGPERG